MLSFFIKSKSKKYSVFYILQGVLNQELFEGMGNGVRIRNISLMFHTVYWRHNYTCVGNLLTEVLLIVF